MSSIVKLVVLFKSASPTASIAHVKKQVSNQRGTIGDDCLAPLLGFACTISEADAELIELRNAHIDSIETMHSLPLVNGDSLAFVASDSVLGSVVSTNASSHFDRTGFFVWPGCKFMALYLQRNPSLVAGRRVVELGAGGSGILAVLATKHLTHPATAWIATDWGNEAALTRLRSNIALSDVSERAIAVEYQWGNSDISELVDANEHVLGGAIYCLDPFRKKLDLVLAADVVYPSMSHHQIGALLAAFQILYNSPLTHISEFYCAYVNRDMSGETLKRFLREIKKVNCLWVEMIPFPDDFYNTGGSMIRLWFQDSDPTGRKNHVDVVGDDIMPGLWTRTVCPVEQWTPPFTVEDQYD